MRQRSSGWRILIARDFCCLVSCSIQLCIYTRFNLPEELRLRNRRATCLFLTAFSADMRLVTHGMVAQTCFDLAT